MAKRSQTQSLFSSQNRLFYYVHSRTDLKEQDMD